MNKIDASNEEAWLAQRWELVTGSAAAALTGLSPFKTQEELLGEYVKKETSFKPNRKAWFGQQLEVAIGRTIGAALNCSFSPMNELRWETGTDIGATTDGYLTAEWGGLPDIVPSGHKKNWTAFMEEATSIALNRNLWVEIKNVGHYQLKRWNQPDNPPPYYWAQCQTQLLVTGEEKMALVAMVGGQDLRGHIIKRDDSYLDKLKVEAKKFMGEVREWREL